MYYWHAEEKNSWIRILQVTNVKFSRNLPYALVAQCEKFGEIWFSRIRVIALQTQEMRNFLIHKEVWNF